MNHSLSFEKRFYFISWSNNEFYLKRKTGIFWETTSRRITEYWKHIRKVFIYRFYVETEGMKNWNLSTEFPFVCMRFWEWKGSNPDLTNMAETNHQTIFQKCSRHARNVMFEQSGVKDHQWFVLVMYTNGIVLRTITENSMRLLLTGYRFIGPLMVLHWIRNNM